MTGRHVPMYLALAMTPLYVAVGFTTGLAIRRSGVDVHWAEWASAAGTVAAVVVALRVSIRDGRRREEDRKDEQAAQARYVVSKTRADMFGARIYVEVTNNSSSPVFAVVVENVHVSPDPLRVRFLNDRSWARLDPGQSVKAAGTTYRMDGTTPEDVQEPNLITADISFVDAAGLRWRRWANEPPRGGAPVKRREPPQPVPEVEPPDDDVFTLLDDDDDEQSGEKVSHDDAHAEPPL